MDPVTSDSTSDPTSGSTRAGAGRSTSGATGGEPGTGSAPPPSLHVSGLAYAYPDGHQALFGVDLTVPRGERVALLGPNGAGKTTLVLHLNGILTAGAGSVTVAGLPVGREHLAEIRRRVGIVFQDPDDQLFMPTVREDVAFGPATAGLRGAELASRVHDALARVGMEAHADRPPHHLSFGQRRRVAVATVLAMQPEILVLDEPSSNLDPASRRELADILQQLDVTVLMVTHDLPYALQLCPRSVVLSDGVIVADGATQELLCDEALLAAHRLELPFGFDPGSVRVPQR
nr:ABC transporter ATP-binding protein [Streptomyces sp. DSM 40971]